LGSFQAALQAGVDGIELDVQLSRDGEVVVIHDAYLDRTTNGSGRVSEHTIAELRQLDAARWFSKAHRGAKIPILTEVLQMLYRWPTPVVLNIEFKTAAGRSPDARLALKTHNIVQRSGLQSRIVYSSFDHQTLFVLKEADPTVHIGLLYDLPIADCCKYATSVHASSIHPDYLWLTKDEITRAHGANLRVCTYTVNDMDVARTLMDWRVDAIITDCPDVLLRG